MTASAVRLAAACAAMLACAAGPGAASQPQPERAIGAPEADVPLGSRIPRWREVPLAGEREAAAVLRSFGRCIVRTQRSRAEALVRSAPDSAEMSRLSVQLVGRPTRCLSARRMSLTSALFRGALAEALLAQPDLAGLAVAPAPAPENFDAFAALAISADVDGLDEEDRALLVGRWMATCIAHQQPEIIRRLLATSGMAAEERRLLAASEAAFNNCLDSGQVLRVDQLTLRAVLAEALYLRLAGAAR